MRVSLSEKKVKQNNITEGNQNTLQQSSSGKQQNQMSNSEAQHGAEAAPTSDEPQSLKYVAEKRIVVVRKIFGLMGPVIMGSILSFSTQSITNSFVGRRLGAELFAHYTLGISVANLFGFSVGVGLNGALDTFVSQAFGRDKQATRDIGVSMQRACVLSFLASIPLGGLLIWGGPLFRLMFGDELGDGALEFTQHAVPNLLLYFGVNIMTKVVHAINLPDIVVYCTAISAVSCFIINYFLTHSIATAVLTLTLTYAIDLLSLALFIRFHPKITFWKHCDWPSHDSHSLPGLKQFLAVGIPSMVGVCAEWWAFEVLNIVGASISVHDVAALNLVLTIGWMYLAISLAVAVSSSVLVGNALGENRPVLARQYATCGLLIGQSINLIDTAVLFLFRREIAGIFTEDERLKDTFCNMIFVIVAYIWGDATQFYMQNIFRSTGQQRTSARLVLMSLWAIGLPLSVVFGKWLGMGAGGVVLGLVCGFAVEIPLMLRCLTTWSWDQLAETASKRLDVDLEGPGSNEAKSLEEGCTEMMSTNKTVSLAGGVEDAHRDEGQMLRCPSDQKVEPSHAVLARETAAAVCSAGFGAHVHTTHPRSSCTLPPTSNVSPRHLDAEGDLVLPPSCYRIRDPSRPVSRIRGGSFVAKSKEI